MYHATDCILKLIDLPIHKYELVGTHILTVITIIII